MSKGKKLFESRDFDKHKKLFESGDFDKQEGSADNAGHNHNESNEKGRIPTGNAIWSKIIIAIVAIGTITGSIIYVSHSKSENESGNNTNSAAVANSTSGKPSGDIVKAANDSATDKTQSVTSGEDANNISGTTEFKNNPTKEEMPAENNSKGTNIEGSTEAIANDVIAGKYDNWPERERKLGNRYREVQNKVNDMYRRGLVK